MEHKNILSERIRELRNEQGLTQAEIAKKIGVTKSAYGFWEQGKNQPDIDTIARLAEIFDVTADYLFGISDIKNSTSNYSDEKSNLSRTIAAHLDGAELSKADIDDIARFIEFVKQKGNSDE